MTASRGHHEALRARHLALETRLREAQKHPSTSSALIKKLKAEKLRLKDEIEGERKTASG